MKRKDMTLRQFEKACERRGIKVLWDSTFGCCRMNAKTPISVSRLNGGSALRQQLAYLIKEQTKIDNGRYSLTK